MKKKLFRVSAVPGSLATLLKGQLRFMNEYFDVIGIASDGLLHKTVRENEGIDTITIRIERKIKVWADIISLYRLYRLFKKEKPFIVHSMTPKAGLLSMMAAYLAGVPHRLHTFTGLVFPTSSGLMKKVLIFFDKVICFCATRVYPEGEGVKRDLIRYGITQKPLKIIGQGNINGIDLSYFDPALFDKMEGNRIKKKWGIKESDFVFCFIGRIVLDKGIVELVTSFLEVSRSLEGIKLLIVGPMDNESNSIPANIVQEMTENPDIINIGWQQDVRPFLAIAHVFVFPSYREGFPNVLLQAGAMGKFSIVTDINGSNEIIMDGVNGIIIPAKDGPSLTEAMVNAVENRAEHESPNSGYREMISERYDQKLVWQAQLEEYRQLEISEPKVSTHMN